MTVADYLLKMPYIQRGFQRQKKQRRKKRNNSRMTSRRKVRQKIYNDKRWKSLADEYRRTHPLCEDCEEGWMCDCKVEPATEVHHIVSFMTAYLDDEQINEQMQELAFDKDNLRALCRCHHLLRHSILMKELPPHFWEHEKILENVKIRKDLRNKKI